METIKKTLPNSTGTLVLGLLSIISCWLYGLLGVILAIIALVISKKSIELYNQSPAQYEGYGNLKAGRVMAIIGLVLSGLYFLFILIAFAIIGAAGLSIWTILENMQQY
jgi:cellulose synthase/poly-beta-1,6-N-acetylglucosamine synthase-like glycosyltransferase